MFNKFADKHNLDPYRMSTFTHLIYFIPKLTQDPALYKSSHFIEQVGVVTFYRNLYKIICFSVNVRTSCRVSIDLAVSLNEASLVRNGAAGCFFKLDNNHNKTNPLYKLPKAC